MSKKTRRRLDAQLKTKVALEAGGVTQRGDDRRAGGEVSASPAIGRRRPGETSTPGGLPDGPLKLHSNLHQLDLTDVTEVCPVDLPLRWTTLMRRPQLHRANNNKTW
jgi:hypothetical protein